MFQPYGDQSIDNTSAFDMSSPHSLRHDDFSPQREHDYNFSGEVYDQTTDHASTTDEEQNMDRHSLLQSAPSRHSSVSSFPASVVYHSPSLERSITPSRSPFYHGRATTPTISPRPHSTGFRHPSSVRALQMRDEFDSTDCEDMTPNHRRRNSKLSYLSYRPSSSHSSPTKSLRSSRSAHTSPSKSRSKQEFPLVLLHCSLLAPQLSARAKLLSAELGDEQSLLEAIIPEPYTKKWKILQEKVVRNAEVKSRGILIPHPREDYDLLEERLLESLELERPRIRQGHYLSKSEADTGVDSGFESGDTDSDTQQSAKAETVVGQEEGKCPDCGHQLSHELEAERSWDVKVFAANGLMKSGAWSAGWSEMEKVDVEVGVWMPENVRREVDARLEALIAKELEAKPKKVKGRKGMDEQRTREIYGEPTKPEVPAARNQEEIDGFSDRPRSLDDQVPNTFPPAMLREQQHVPHLHPAATNLDPDLSVLLANYIRLLAQDPRNIAILLLSILLSYYGIWHNSARTELIQAANADILSSSSHVSIQTPTQAYVALSSAISSIANSEPSIAIEVPIEYIGSSSAQKENLAQQQDALIDRVGSTTIHTEEDLPTAIDTKSDAASATLERIQTDQAENLAKAHIQNDKQSQAHYETIQDQAQCPIANLFNDDRNSICSPE